MADSQLSEQIWRKIHSKTKPLGSLGQLESLAHQIALVQQTTRPSLKAPTLLVFAGDHGITDEGVSAYPREVTWQMVQNYLSGGAAVNVFARQNGLVLQVIDAGVDHDFGELSGLIDRKVARASGNFRKGPALSPEQWRSCLDHGAALIRELAATGCNVVGFGEMGIGNTSAAAALMSCFCDLPIETCTGRGAGLDDSGLAHKTQVLAEALAFHGPKTSADATMRTYAGLEMAMMAGAMLAAHEAGLLLLIDGFIVTSVLLYAHAVRPRILDACVFAHVSEERGHGAMLQFLGVKPLLNLGLRLGEGTGVALAWPIVQAAVVFLEEMASFSEAGVAQANP